MDKIDWSKAPEDAEFNVCGFFGKTTKPSDGVEILFWTKEKSWFAGSDGCDLRKCTRASGFEVNPKLWVKDEGSGYRANFNNKEYLWVLNLPDGVPIEKAWPESEERVDIIGTNGGDGMHYDEFREDEEAPALKPRPTYNRDIVGLDGTKTTVDVYRVLDAFKTESAAIDHAVKKLLCAGIRHQKGRKQDLEEAIKSIQAELLLMSQR